MTHKNNRLRIARPTNRLDLIAQMYCKGLDFDVLGYFKDHQGFDGVIVGHPNHAYHLEFTHHRGTTVPDAPTADNLLVFYIPDEAEWRAACTKMELAGFLVWFHITHIGINMEKRLPISMAIALCYRILIGIDDFSLSKLIQQKIE